MKIALVAIGRLDSEHAREFVEHHLKVGFDHVIIVGSRRDGADGTLQDLIDAGRVTIDNLRGTACAQRNDYNAIYREHGRSYDWLAFFDSGEQLCLADGLYSIKQVLETLDGRADCVMVPWAVTGAGNAIVRGSIKGLSFSKSAHVPMEPVLRCVLPTGAPTQQRREQPRDFSVAYLKHPGIVCP